MKKLLLPAVLLLTVSVLALAACSAKTGTASSSSSSPGAADQELSQAAQLLVGTLKLEGTEDAVDVTQAADLLPLWQAYRQLTNSDTATQAEIEAVVAQIQATMTAEQVQAITATKLTQQDELSVISSLGLFTSNGTSGASATGAPQVFTFNGNSSGFNPGAGGAPSGGGALSGGVIIVGGDAGGFPGSGSGQTISTQVAPSQDSMDQVPALLLNALIELLQVRTGS